MLVTSNLIWEGKNILNAKTQPETQPSYYAVIPASVRYDKNIPQGAKLLYGEISSLCNKEGYCWAGNEYFASLYQTSERTVINWINKLKDKGHISVSYTYVPGKKEIQSRLLRLTDNAPPKNNAKTGENTGQANPDGGADQEGVKISSPRGEKKFTTYGKNFQEVVKNFSKGGEKNFTDNIKYNIKTTASSPGTQESRAQPPPGEAAVVPLSPQELKEAVSAVDPCLILSGDFYPKAAGFMASNGLDLLYLPWMYEQCKNQNPRSIRGLFYTLFFTDNMPEIYKASRRPGIPPPKPPDIPCPACGTLHARHDDACPSCGLPENASADRISLFRQLRAFPPDKRAEYVLREEEINKQCGIKELEKYTSLIAVLNKEFGIETA
jgi:hypothetical protein